MIFTGETKGYSCPMIFMTSQNGILRSECIGAKCAWWERIWRIPMPTTKTTKIWHEMDVITHGGLPEGATLIGGYCGACKSAFPVSDKK